jgi:hypothetical protein
MVYDGLQFGLWTKLKKPVLVAIVVLSKVQYSS